MGQYISFELSGRLNKMPDNVYSILKKMLIGNNIMGKPDGIEIKFDHPIFSSDFRWWMFSGSHKNIIKSDRFLIDCTIKKINMNEEEKLKEFLEFLAPYISLCDEPGSVKMLIGYYTVEACYYDYVVDIFLNSDGISYSDYYVDGNDFFSKEKISNF
jgi:hypothetical protein